MQTKDAQLPATILERWARERGWQYEVLDTGTTHTVQWEDPDTRVNLAIFSTDESAMIEFWDRKRVRGLILTVRHQNRFQDLLDALAALEHPRPDGLPTLLRALMARFIEVYDSSDGTELRIDGGYLDKIEQ